MTEQLWLWAIPALPLAGSAICAILYMLGMERRPAGAAHGHAPAPEGHAAAAHAAAAHAANGGHGDEAAHAGAPKASASLAALVACAAMAGALALAVKGFFALRSMDGARVIESSAWKWIEVTGFEVDVSMVLDPLSSVMCLVITGVGFLIKIGRAHV